MPDDAIWRGCALRNVPTLERRRKTGGRQGGQPCLTDVGDDHFNDEMMTQPDDGDDDNENYDRKHDKNDNDDGSKHKTGGPAKVSPIAMRLLDDDMVRK